MSQAQIDRRHRAAPVSDDRRRWAISPAQRGIGSARTLAEAIGRAAMVHASEVALMASLAARLPLRLIDARLDPTPDPLRSAEPQTAPPARPVLLIHGFCGTKSSWSLLARSLKARGLTFEAITYTPFRTSVDQLADRLIAAVDRILVRTGADKVHLVGHSLALSANLI